MGILADDLHQVEQSLGRVSGVDRRGVYADEKLTAFWSWKEQYTKFAMSFVENGLRVGNYG